jgi:hypothetical protein
MAPKPHPTFAEEADRARAMAERMTDPILKQQWLRIEARYRALANGSLTIGDLGTTDGDIEGR